VSNLVGIIALAGRIPFINTFSVVLQLGGLNFFKYVINKLLHVKIIGTVKSKNMTNIKFSLTGSVNIPLDKLTSVRVARGDS